MPDDVLNDTREQRLHWSRTNVGEAMPGVLTPLAWTVFGRAGDVAARRAAHAIGAISRAERDEFEIVRVFHGRAAMHVEFMALLGDRFPGTSGREAAASVFGRVPEDMSFSPTRRRYPMIAARLPWAFVSAPRRLRALAAEQDRQWRESLARVDGLDGAGAIAMFRATLPRFEHAVTLQTVALLGVVQPMYDALGRLVARAGTGDVAILSGSGGAEMAVVGDIWRASRGELTVEQVIDAHGFHGPLEGELSSRVWREDDAPLRAMIERYAARDEGESPVGRDREAERVADERALLAALPGSERPAARALLALARGRVPLRGVAKRSFLQAYDVVRASARQAGRFLCEDGVIADPEDVFFLTSDELCAAPRRDLTGIVAERRAQRAAHAALELPGEWTGLPPVTPRADTGDGVRTTALAGVGVSPGVVEGRVRVVTDPAFTDVEPDEVLVAPFTDPSWASIMFVSSALVVDIGGALSHAAVVARELEIPCVVNTRTGTTQLRTGDHVRVDGTRGTVEILTPAEV